MHFNQHWNLKDKHAFLSPSQYHWIRYTDEKLMDRYAKSQVARRGSELHQLAHDCIRLRVKLPATKKTINAYVNDSINYRMTSEQTLFYSDNCFGTADAIGFRKNMLRIFDFKSGETTASVDQLMVYGALFCLEYGFKPFDIEYDLRLYQSDEIAMFETDPDDIAHIMDKIITFSRRIDEMRTEDRL